MQLSFTLPEPRSFERIRSVFQALASALTGRPVSLHCDERREEADQNYGQNTCFVAKWSDGPITWTESVLSGSGNPRDGYGYDVALTLTLPTLTLKAGGGGYEPVPTSLSLDFTSSGGAWLKLRQTLRRELGEEHDRSASPYLVTPVLHALTTEGAEAAALELARECLANTKRTEWGREVIVAWVAAHDPTAGGAAMRVREAPAALDGWLELERAGDSTLAETFARLCPFDLARWKAAALPIAAWFSHPAWPFARDAAPDGAWRTIHLPARYLSQALAAQVSVELTGWHWGTDWQDVHGEALPVEDLGWHWTVSRRARCPADSKVPIVHVTLEGVRREPEEWSLPWKRLSSMPLRETQRWSFIGGPETGDAVVIVERALPWGSPTPSPVGFTFAVVGSAEFRARAEAAVTKFTQLRWYPVPAHESLLPHELAEQRLTDAGSALEATLPPDQLARAKVLLACRCEHPRTGYCEHRVELLNRSREERQGDPAGRARSAAWEAAFAATGSQPNHEAERRSVREAHEQLQLAAEFTPL